MMAASARTSGTTSPFASVLNCGVIASWSCARLRRRACSRARAEARARARFARRVLDAVAEYAVAGFLRAAVDDVDEAEADEVRRVVVFFCVVAAETEGTGRHSPTPSSVATSRTVSIGRFKRTGHPLDATNLYSAKRIRWERPPWY